MILPLNSSDTNLSEGLPSEEFRKQNRILEGQTAWQDILSAQHAHGTPSEIFIK